MGVGVIHGSFEGVYLDYFDEITHELFRPLKPLATCAVRSVQKKHDISLEMLALLEAEIIRPTYQ